MNKEIFLLHLRNISKRNLIINLFYITILSLSLQIFEITRSFAITCGIISIIISLYPVFFSLKERIFSAILSCIVVFSLAPIWFLYLEVVLSGYDAITYIQPQYIVESLLLVSVFMFFVNSLYFIFWRSGIIFSIKKLKYIKGLKLKKNTFYNLTLLSFILPLIAFAIYYNSFNTLWTALTAGRAEGGGSSSGLLVRGSKGDNSAYMLPLTWVWQLTPFWGTIAFLHYFKENKFRAYTALSISFSVIFVFFLSGSRGTLMYVGAPLFFFLFYYNWNKGIKFWLWVLPLLIVLIGVMELQVRFRSNLLDILSDTDKAAKLYGTNSVTTFDPSKSHRDNNMYLFCLMVRYYPEKHEFEGFNDLIATLVNPIPRSIWPSKPLLDGAKDISQMKSFILEGPLDIGTTSLSYSIIGEAYYSFGILGLLTYSFFYFSFLLFFDGFNYHVMKSKPETVGVLGISIFLAFWGYRGFFALVSFFYPLLVLLLILRFFSRK